MKKWRFVYLGTLIPALAVGLGLWTPLKRAVATEGPKAPRFRVDPFWPKPLPVDPTQISPTTGKPKPWVTGEVGGTCIDSHDHVFTVNRAFQTGGLISPETVIAVPSPPVVEYDREGNVANAWGSQAKNPDGSNAVMPHGIHGCFVDYQDNVWIAGNGDGVVQKWSHDGSTKLLQIGTKGLCDGPVVPTRTTNPTCGSPGFNSSKTLLNEPADLAVDPTNGDVYIADGYGNHRVVVFDKDGHFKHQFGKAGSGPGEFAVGDGGHPHCVVISKAGLVYACDRGQDRIEVFKKDGTWLRDIPVKPGTGTPGLGTAGSAWDLDFSPDKNQTFMFEVDGGNEILWTFSRATEKILGGFGRPGHLAGEFTFLHTVSVDSRGNLFAGETIGGRRLQKFVKADSEGDSEGDEN
jgi:hypothetical protein